MEDSKREEELRIKELELQKKELELRNRELELDLYKSKQFINKKMRNLGKLAKVFIPLTVAILAVTIMAIFYGIIGGHSPSSVPQPSPALNVSASSTGTITFTPLSNSLLSQINNYPASDLIYVAKGLLNGSINIPIDSNTQDGLFSLASSGINVPAVTTNGKIDFYFAGQDACQFCGRARWAIDLALSQFGSFSSLYTGYTFGDANYPTLFWSSNIHGKSNIPYPYQNYTFGNSYSSKSINFISVDLYPETGSGFYSPVVSYMESAYSPITPLFLNASKYDNVSLSGGQFGTPLELFGNYIVNGAFTDVPIPYNSFSSIISSFYSLNSEFAIATVSSADMYIADFCHVNSSAGAICSEYNWSSFYSRFG